MAQLNDTQVERALDEIWRAVMVTDSQDERDPAVPVTYWETQEEAGAHLRAVRERTGRYDAEGYVTPCRGRTEVSENRRNWIS